MDSSVGDKANEQAEPESGKVGDVKQQRKRRLSRREQKARKKKKKEHAADSTYPTEDARDGDKGKEMKMLNKESGGEQIKKKKKRRGKKNRKKPTSEATGPSDETTSPPRGVEIEHEDTCPYVSTPVPSIQDLEQEHGKKAGTSLGKWFPNAVITKSLKAPCPVGGGDKSSSTAKASLVLFYQYVDPLWPERVTEQLMAYLLQIAKTRVLGGRIRVAREGVNATLSSLDDGRSSAATTLRHFVRDLQLFDNKAFGKTDFKFVEHLSGDRHFKDFKVFPVKELVYYGLGDDSAPLSKGGTHLSATAFHEKLQEANTVVVDVRNHYEAAIGRFDGQEQPHAPTQTEKTADKEEESEENAEENKAEETSTAPAAAAAAAAATYVDPKMRKSTDFASWLQKEETVQQLAGKQVLLYCTGGVRCERASAHLNQTLGDQLNGVYQLQGGVERYLQTFQDGGFWRGKNFVFDKREACSAENPDGDGGVIGASGGKSAGRRKKKTSGGMLPEMKCCECQKPWDRYVGKKKCDTCGVPVLMCDDCMSKKKKADKPVLHLIRCPLCVEENVTVRAQDVDWTDNGRGTAAEPDHVRKPSQNGPDNENNKAAPTVLKWGGGHALNKKERRRFQNTPCRFGADCARRDCFFAHPQKDGSAGR